MCYKDEYEYNLIALFVEIDDFCTKFEPLFRKFIIDNRVRRRKCSLILSEIMTIIVLFHQSGCRTFKKFYKVFAQFAIKKFFLLVSYGRFVELMQSAIFPLFCFLQTKLGTNTGISFIDSTPINVCNVRRRYSNKVFKGLAKLGKNSCGWFFGFKLHIIINDKGEILSYTLTPGNVDDRKPVMEMTEGLIGSLFGDRGYISSELFKKLFSKGLKLVTKLKKNMKNKLMNLSDKILLKKRGLIECVNNQLKLSSQIEHSRHRSVSNFLVNLFGGIIAYTLQKKKPSLRFSKNEFKFIDHLSVA